MKLDITNFRTWMKDPVTVALFSTLEEVREEIEAGMENSDNISASDCHLRMMKLLGIREGIDLVLNINYEDIDHGEDDVAETDKTSRT